VGVAWRAVAQRAGGSCMEVTCVFADNIELGDDAQRARWERQRLRRGRVAQSGRTLGFERPDAGRSGLSVSVPTMFGCLDQHTLIR
jgi:hypothetical protein